MAKNIRDLLEGPPHPSEANDLRTIVAENPPLHSMGDDLENPLTPWYAKTGNAALPGDELPETFQTGNPFLREAMRSPLAFIERIRNRDFDTSEDLQAACDAWAILNRIEGPKL